MAVDSLPLVALNLLSCLSGLLDRRQPNESMIVCIRSRTSGRGDFDEKYIL
jgi:hypothetical protein